MRQIQTMGNKNSNHISYTSNVHIKENMEVLMSHHHEELMKYERMVESDEEKLNK